LPAIARRACGFSVRFLVRHALFLDVLDIQDPPESVAEIKNCWVGIRFGPSTFAAVAPDFKLAS
jgi:hypothetical protein